ncbi:MAG: 2-succinylbenzoate--CoA ligase [Pelatocladus maniniholoensis HA4357-MV3]|uniref:2-succinylbenzoate--CoA ligase n=1 Tax=Pelatocladus maniniholoensis HA4357-MV3 TaxID=1117104 RepID=A0A9E3H5W8_9NOST|nr:2-succinylbenzoate--CoA ligase [Pelatocladus maniniholoensis HA4357-MV3]
MERLKSFSLVCDRSDKLAQLTEQFYSELIKLFDCQTTPKVILAEREPVRFLAGFIAAYTAKCPVFLCNPNWAKQEWQQVFDVVQPDIIWGASHNELIIHNNKSNYQLPITNYPYIMIPTGGSSGNIKFAVHTWETLTASVRGFTEYFQLQTVNSFCVLPLYHVSGFMQFMRCFTTGGELVISPFKELESRQLDQLVAADFFISLVPTQLQSLLQNSNLTAWLSQFQTVLLGGAPAWDEILEKARYYQIKLAPTYGMTETASQIATLKPDDFIKRKVNSGQTLPHAKIIISNEKGEYLKNNQTGNIIIQAESLALGYYPLISNLQTIASNFLTDDVGFIDNEGYLNIVGRKSDKIITGGENVYPTEIESAIKATAMVNDVCVVGIPDQYWGQAVTAIYVPKNSNHSVVEIQNLLRDKLSKFKLPKHWLAVEKLPRNSQGKINRHQLQEIALENLNNSEK